MKLSEAIRLGPAIAPAIYGPVFKRDWRGQVCGACRAGATVLAAGYRPSCDGMADWYGVQDFIKQVWPWTDQLCGHYPFSLGVATGIALLHENRRWSADQIADYIKPLGQTPSPPST